MAPVIGLCVNGHGVNQRKMVAAAMMLASVVVHLLPKPQFTGMSRRLVFGAAAAATLAFPARTSAALPTGSREEMATCIIAAPGREPVSVPRPRYTGAGDPSWIYKETPLPLFSPSSFPASWPYTDADFTRIDEDADTRFYRVPKLVYHIDEGAVCALMRYYDAHIPDNSDVLDIASSW
jgi:hypothetical protein